ncbi:MAG: hypothetical protein V1739_00345 [Candidatus Omnitrophota bacterium]
MSVLAGTVRENSLTGFTLCSDLFKKKKDDEKEMIYSFFTMLNNKLAPRIIKKLVALVLIMLICTQGNLYAQNKSIKVNDGVSDDRLSPQITLDSNLFNQTYKTFYLSFDQKAEKIAGLSLSTFPQKYLRAVNVTDGNLNARWSEYLNKEQRAIGQKALLFMQERLNLIDRLITDNINQKIPSAKERLTHWRNEATKQDNVRADCFYRNELVYNWLIEFFIEQSKETFKEKRNYTDAQLASEQVQQQLEELAKENIRLVDNGPHRFVLFNIGQDKWFVIDAAADQFEMTIPSELIGLVVMPFAEGKLNLVDTGLLIGKQISFEGKGVDNEWAFGIKRNVYGDTKGLFPIHEVKPNGIVVYQEVNVSKIDVSVVKNMVRNNKTDNKMTSMNLTSHTYFIEQAI